MLKHTSIGGTTIHTGLDIQFGHDYLPLTDQKLQQLRVELRDLALIIIDEISMVSSDMMYIIHRRLKDLFISDDYFGGKAVVLVGDLMQLKPVRAPYIFTSPRGDKNKTLHDVDSLWSTFQVVVLETNHRQKDGSNWAAILNHIRVGEQSEDDVNFLLGRKISMHRNEDLSQAAHVYFTNAEVHAFNMKKLHEIPGQPIILKAKCLYPKWYKPTISPFGTIDSTQFCNVLEVKRGARVMVTFNISIKDSLVNGLLGSVVDVVIDDKMEATAVIVSFDNVAPGADQRQKNTRLASKYSAENGTPIFRSSFEYQLSKRSSSKQHASKGRILQFPLRLSWASTAHKMQGITVQKGTNLVIHGHHKMPPAMSYVMLGRCQDVANVFLDDNFDVKSMVCTQTALAEKISLDARSIVPSYDTMSFDLFVVNIRSLNKHFDDLREDIYAQKSTVLCLVETWIDDINQKFELDQRYFTASSIGPGKGCPIFSRMSPRTIKKYASESFQLLLFEIFEDFQVLLLYVSQSCCYGELLAKVQAEIDPGRPLVVLGDFNFDAKDSNVFTLWLASLKMEQVINTPTHAKGRIIDHVYVPMERRESVLIDLHHPYYTDHASICLKFGDFKG